MSQFIDRMIRAAKLDVNLYEEVEADKSALKQAMGVVVLSSIAMGIGNMGMGGSKNLILGIISSLIGWFVWAYITYFIGVKILPEPQTRADHGELLRTIGFSSSPGILRIFAIIPGFWYIVNAVVSIWTLTAMIIAVRQALDYKSTMRAIGVCIIGWIVQSILFTVMYVLMGV
ncbi:YIP1 family protein [Candidatus Latescibacterota bacterium]